MIKGMNTLDWVAILCGILGFDGNQNTIDQQRYDVVVNASETTLFSVEAMH